MKKPITFFLFALTIHFTFGQDCNQSFQNAYLHGNEIRAVIPSGGELFWNLQNAVYQVPFQGAKSPSTIFASTLWMIGKDSAGFVSALQTYRTANKNDLWSGPLDANGRVFPNICKQWDKVWSITKADITRHKADLADNGRIDNPVRSIYGYPAKGNAFFSLYNGFALPNGDFAPFYDANKDGIYTPQYGDFPLPAAVDSTRIPAQMTWHVYNDRGGVHTSLGGNGRPLGVEVQLTTWAFEVESSNKLMNRSIFTSHKIINKSSRNIEDFTLGLWTDYDLGCSTDDFMGCDSTTNTSYAYNSDSVDGTVGSICSDPGVYTYGANPPVQTNTFLNRKMSSFMFISNAGSCKPIPAQTDPRVPEEVFNLVNAKWLDGTPLTKGGNGYNPSGIPTNYAFPSDPTDPNGWSQSLAKDTCGDYRGIANSYVGKLKNLESVTLDMAWGTHFYDNISTTQAASNARKDVKILQDAYNVGFKNLVLANSECIGGDCVYPGDLNHDSIADHRDLLTWGYAYGETGQTRSGLLNWQPKTATNWQKKTPKSLDFKHIDGNGNGKIDSADFELTQVFFNNTIEPYTPVLKEKEGNDLVIKANGSLTNLDKIPSSLLRIDISLRDTVNVLGFAFTVKIEQGLPQNGISRTSILNADGQTSFYSPYLSNNLDSTFSFAMVKRDKKVIDGSYGFFIPTTIKTIMDLRFYNVIAIKTDGTIVDLGQSKVRFKLASFSSATKDADDKTVQVFPNPFSEKINVLFPNKTAHVVEVIDVLGKSILLKKGNFTEGVDLETNGMAKGIYFIKLTIDNQIFTKKVVKQ